MRELVIVGDTPPLSHTLLLSEVGVVIRVEKACPTATKPLSTMSRETQNFLVKRRRR